MITILTGLMTAVLTVLGSGSVTQLSILPVEERTEIVIAVEGDFDYRDFTMAGPDRLVLDFFGSRHALGRDNFAGIDRGGIRAVRTSQYAEDVVRVVFELEREVEYRVIKGDGYIRIALLTTAEAFEPWSSRAGGALASVPEIARQLPNLSQSGFSSANRPGILTSTDDPARRITVSFTNTPISDVFFTFAEFAGRSIVPGSDVRGTVSADIRDQPWDVALQAILESHGLSARERESGIIRVDNVEKLSEREAVEQLVTRTFRISFAVASEVETALQPLLSDRGRVAISEGTNTVIVTDVPRVVSDLELLIRELDIRTPQITIAAKIIFVNRTDLKQFGVSYDLKDTRGNQLNDLTSGFVNGVPIEQGTNAVLLDGNSIAALGNANARVIGPALTVLTSLVMGRHTLVSFIDALQSVNMSDIQASPQVSTLDNQPAKILVGERTPIRVIDAQAGGVGPGAPQATVQIQETGIVLEVTPHVTAGDLILLSIRAERSAVELADSDVGFIFRTQEAVSRVLVQDGHAAVIGGLTVTERTELRTGIPILMSLPVVGRIFRVTSEQQIQRDLMILVTPYINR